MELKIKDLLQSDEVCVGYKVRTGVLGEDPQSSAVRELREEIRCSPRVQTLLSERLTDGTLPFHPYQKWRGAHWILSILADLGYPPGDASLHPLREQVYGWLLSSDHLRKVPVIQGRARRCASQEGNALYSTLALGIADERAGELARNLIRWQWPDGGWNCDKKPQAHHSSFWESLIPLRGLALHARLTGSPESKTAAKRAAEFFLEHELYKRHSSGEPIYDEFLTLHYPCYWRYDILFGLKVMAEGGWISDPRCQPALDRLRSLRLPDGGFPAASRFYRVTGKNISGSSLVAWGPVTSRQRNDFVTADALGVLSKAG